MANGELPTSFPLDSKDDEAPVSEKEDRVQSSETQEENEDTPILDMVICSFALHLVETPSQLFGLLWELSQKARWLVIIAPHKKPEVRPSYHFATDIMFIYCETMCAAFLAI